MLPWCWEFVSCVVAGLQLLPDCRNSELLQHPTLRRLSERASGKPRPRFTEG